nr:DUF2285 domain-containing protein [uncultured Hyphomonas sp.]
MTRDHDPVLSRYDYTARLSRSRWAWEFLRRNQDFRDDAARHGSEEISRKRACRSIEIIRPRCDQTEASRWGLAFFPDPSLNGFDADAFWCAHLYPRTLVVNVRPRAPGEVDDIFERTTSVCQIRHLSDRMGREQILIKGDGCVVQVRCTGLSLLSLEPVRMHLDFGGYEDADAKIKVFERARQALLDPPDASSGAAWTRSSLILRNSLIALDCIDADLSHRDIAAVLYGWARAEAAWHEPGSALRQEIVRLVRKGRDLRDGGYRELLSHSAGAVRAA